MNIQEKAKRYVDVLNSDSPMAPVSHFVMIRLCSDLSEDQKKLFHSEVSHLLLGQEHEQL
jgi:hypothetical protein